MAIEPGIVERAHQEIATLVVTRTHLLHSRRAVFECFERGVLAHDRCAEHRVLVNFHHRLDDRLRRAGITKAETGHGKRLGKSVKQNRALAHPGKRGDREVRLLVVAEFTVDLIGDHHQIVLDGELRNAFEVGPGGAGSSRVGREIEHQHPRTRRDGGGEVFRAQRKTVLSLGLNRHRNPMRHDDARAVGHIARLVIDHFIARVHQRAQGEIDGFGNAHGDQNLTRRIIADVKEILDIPRNRASQCQGAEVRGVGRLAFFQRINRRLANVPRRREIRLAHTQRNHIVAPLHQFKEIANPRTRDGGDVAGDFRLVIHEWAGGITTALRDDVNHGAR